MPSGEPRFLLQFVEVESVGGKVNIHLATQIRQHTRCLESPIFPTTCPALDLLCLHRGLSGAPRSRRLHVQLCRLATTGHCAPRSQIPPSSLLEQNTPGTWLLVSSGGRLFPVAFYQYSGPSLAEGDKLQGPQGTTEPYIHGAFSYIYTL